MPVSLRLPGASAAPLPAVYPVRIHSDIVIHSRRLDTPLWNHAQALAHELAAARAQAAEDAGGSGDQPTEAGQLADAKTLLTVALAKLAWVDWEGVTDQDSGEPIPFAPDLIEPAVMQLWDVASIWYVKYTSGITGEVQEKNGSASAAGGTGATAPTTAASAPTPTAPVPEVSPA